jgi:MYXO-CTERM domain-containing protein
VCRSDTGKCATTCASVADCVAPNVCNSSGQCVAPAASSGSSGGCRAAPGGASNWGGVWLLGVTLLARRMRRRTPTRTAPR